MSKPGVRRSILQRVFGICATRPPADQGCWKFEGGKVIVTLSRAPELAGENGAIRLEGMGMLQRVLVFRGRDGKYHALSNRCMHMGRRLDPVPGAEQVDCCSLGRSSYDHQGRILSGMARRNVLAFPVAEEGGELSIQIQ
ncbi:MAG: Rieske (2Fe-2S) protein [Deltaproteobacteria bacterium]|nr:Rieske (2Fe-2S) protein [Deltaproteobacteria bacterium]